MLMDTVRKTIREHDLIHKGDHIVLGLSGGPDSVCLFHVLQRLAKELELTIHPVHINHRFRPGAAEEDQAYAEELCAKAAEAGASALPCRTFVVDCDAMAREQGMTSEEAGRKARYDAFAQVAEEWLPGVRIAVAQNANDQAETILHRILRGTGVDGLAGIAYERAERGIPVIRPLLDVPRSQIEAYCAENGLDPVTDHTNNEPIYTRNRIRLQLLPQMEEFNPNIIETLTRLGRIAAADRAYLAQQTEEAYRALRRDMKDALRRDAAGTPPMAAENASASDTKKCDGTISTAPWGDGGILLDRVGLAALPEAIRHRVIARGFREIGLASDVSEERLQAADAIIGKKQAPKTVEFPRGYRLTVKKGMVYLREPE